MPWAAERALALLRQGTGLPDALFREGQEEAIRHVVEGRGRLLLVRKTGWGKSFVYFIASKMLREAGRGPTLLVSPLLALMRNQIAAAERMGVRAATINSANTDEWTEIERSIRGGETDVVIVAPERLANERFRQQVLGDIGGEICLLVIDEAHCISDWGHDFRPHYRLIQRIITNLPGNLRLLATTATANQRVIDDLAEVLGPNVEISRGDLTRESLALQTIELPTQAERLAWIAEQVPRLPGSGIIYVLTKRDAGQVADWLRAHGIDVEPYTGDSGDEREELEQALLENRLKALVATSALGMGFDKPDLGFVIHYQAPGSVVTYYQQVGRAGRALEAAYGVLLSGQEDDEIVGYFIEGAFPTQGEVEEILGALEQSGAGLTQSELMARANISLGRIRKALLLLSLEAPAPIVKQGTRWQLTAAELDPGFWERTRRLTDLRRGEQEEMREYVALDDGHMQFLVRALDGDPGHFVRPDLPRLPSEPSQDLVRDAIAFLRGSNLPLEPRAMWPAGGMPEYGVRGTIDPAHRAQPGIALSSWSDAGWGTQVRQGKYEIGRFGDELVGAAAELVTAWAPDPAPRWVTCIPSLRHPELVPDFARRLAETLGLPFRAVLEKTDDRAEQKAMANSIQQARNVDGSLAVVEGSVLREPVLLVDDMADSRWTLTVAAWLLRTNGAGEVWPLVLAKAGSG